MAERTCVSRSRRHRRAAVITELSWQAVAVGLTNLASDLHVAVCRLHYYLQRMHGYKLESMRRPSQLQLCALEAVFRSDVESYLSGVRQDAGRLEAAQWALGDLLGADYSYSSPSPASSPGSAATGLSPRRAAARTSPSPRQPPLCTLREESSSSDSDNGSRRDQDVRSTNMTTKQKRCRLWDSDSVSAMLAAELGENVYEMKCKECQETGALTRGGDSDGTDTSSCARGVGGGADSSASSGESGAEWCSACGGTPEPRGCQTLASETNASGSGSAGGEGTGGGTRIKTQKTQESSQDSSFTTMELLSTHSALKEIHDHQGELYDDLQTHSQRLMLVASVRRRLGSRRRQLHPSQASADSGAIKQSVEAAVRELLAASAPLLSRAAALRRLAAAVDEARPLQAQKLQHLPSLRLQPLPQLRPSRPRWCCLPLRVFCTDLWRLLHHCCCLSFCQVLWQSLCSCFCCFAHGPRSAAHRRPTDESHWFHRSPPPAASDQYSCQLMKRL
ncbi:uncharacterized protein LOC126335066 isoform X2 [Schistocerca gregaria]|uniref:uncharacterized protein LOC126335066 isoform X2 n=1 Tax=Schistocerca gregaria TaxID=7010 RepID=UPI00211F11A6|nr:uncharacterized protein LOC126335066 isoform X2 [Schistocerca gregaria]